MTDASVHGGEYPRPQLVRDGWASLDGTWLFAYDDADVGLDDTWFEPGRVDAFDRTIQVPFPPESPASGINDTGFHPVVWYRRDVDVAQLLGCGDGPRVLIHFGAVDHSADVWLDGRLVASHVGGQTPFSADVSDVLATSDGPCALVVRAYDDASDADQPTGKQDWQLEPHNIWYERTTGIWQPVWCEAVPSTSIMDVWWAPRLDDGAVDLEVSVTGPIDDELALSVRLRDGEDVLAVVTLPAGARVRTELTPVALGDPRRRAELTWSPDHPVLLDADVWLHPAARPEHAIDQVASYVGMRSVAVGNGHFRLNGEPFFVRAVLNQGYRPQTHLAPPSADALRQEVETALALGFNTMRIHQKAEDPRLLYFADSLGLLVWAETANARAYSSRAAQLLTDEWTEIVRRDRSHPSVVAWVPLNESWGAPEVAVEEEQQDFVRALATLTRALDPSRPVMANEGWEHVDSDIVGIHDYANDPALLVARYGSDEAVLATIDGPGPQDRPLVLTREQRQSYVVGQTPAMLTEFGGVSYAMAETWGYTTVSSTDEYAAVLEGLFAAVLSCRGIVGFCFTQLADTRQEANGLLTEDRRPKLPVEHIAAMVSGTLTEPSRRLVVEGQAKGAVRAARRRLRPVKAFARRMRPGNDS